jgi:uncharacterized protein
MTKTFTQRHPYWAAVIAAVICTFFSALGSAVSQIVEAEGAAAYAIMTGGVAASLLTGLLLMRTSGFSPWQLGFRKPSEGSLKQVWLYLPLVLLEIVPIIMYGSIVSHTLGFYAVLALFTLAVGLNEELYFRGLVFSFLSRKGAQHAVVGSSIIFGVLHAVNALSGTNIWHVLLQIAFAFLVGLVLALIIRITKSLWVGILWHAVHNFLSYCTEVEIDRTALIVVGAQVLILLIYAIGLWKKSSTSRA